MGTNTRTRTVRRVLAWVLLAGWIAVAAAAPFAAERDATWDRLAGALEDGRVDTVTVVGEPLEGTGFSVLDVRWRDGGIGRLTTVEERSGREASGQDVDHVVQTADGSLVEELRALSPDLEVSVEPRSGGASMNLLGLRLVGLAATGVFVLGITTLMLLVAGPEPERATKWAWFWLFCVAAPIACPAYLALGGMVREEPEPAAKRLTGGWAFLVFLLLGGATAAATG